MCECEGSFFRSSIQFVCWFLLISCGNSYWFDENQYGILLTFVLTVITVAAKIFGCIATTYRACAIRLWMRERTRGCGLEKFCISGFEKKNVYSWAMCAWEQCAQMTLVTLTRSHLSTHREWNSWEQGSTRRICRGSKSHIHTTHDVWSPVNCE